MNSPKLKFTLELISTLTIIPVMIMAIIKSFLLLPLDLSKISISFIPNHYILGIVLLTLQQINMLFAIISIVILLINLQLLKDSIKNPQVETIESWARLPIKLCALSNMAVTWFLDKSNAVDTDLKPALILWTITLILSLIQSLLFRLKK